MTTASRTALYRLYDADEALLYIGVSEDPRARFKQHEQLQPWWFQVAHSAVEWFDDRDAALTAERAAIPVELPRWNRDGMPSTKIRYDVPVPPQRVPTEEELRDERHLEEIKQIAERMAADRARILELIPQVFPEKRGKPAARGRLNEVVKASGWTREYVARIRDGKVTATKES